MNTQSNLKKDNPKIKPRLLWRDISLRYKLIFAFSSLLIMASVSTAYTLFKVADVEKNAISMVDIQEPMTVRVLLLSQKLHESISLLNQIINLNSDKDKQHYKLIESSILLLLQDIQDNDAGIYTAEHVEQVNKLDQLTNAYIQKAKKISLLSDNFKANYPAMALAAELLNPLAMAYLGIINEALGRDDLDVTRDDESVSLEESMLVRKMLYELRYTWSLMVNSFRASFVNQVVGTNEGNINLNNYIDQNKLIIDKLQALHIEIGLGELEQLSDISTQYKKNMPIVVKMQSSELWRTDLHVMETEVAPIVSALKSLLSELVADQISLSKNSGAAVTNDLQQVKLYTSSLLLFAVLMSLVIGMVMLKAFIPPLENLVRAAGRVSEGDLNSEVFVSSNDEIGMLSCSFNQMVNSLREAEIAKLDHLDSLEKMNQDLELRVTERTAALEQSETRIRTIHDSVGEGILVIGEDSNIETVNRAGLAMFGCAEADIIGRHAAILFSSLYDSHSERCVDKHRFLTLMAAHQTAEVEGVRINGDVFPMDMLVTSMSIAGNNSQVCIVRDITKRKQAEERLIAAQNEIVSAAHKSGMAEMATGVLHNIGNILNSVNISVEEVSRIARKSKIAGLLKANAMLTDNMDNIADFIANDSKGQKLPEYYVKLGDLISSEFDNIKDEVAMLSQKTTMMKDVISTQQSYATAGFLAENFDIADTVEDALVVQKSSLEKWGVTVHVSVDQLPKISAQKSRLLQVVTNLVKNAKEAMQDNDDNNKEKVLTITAGIHNVRSVYVCVTDTGCGVTEENLSNIFQHGFTTKVDGHGFGLHASANAMTEMGGSLTVRSAGVGEGTSFTLILPVADADIVGSSSEDENNLRKAV